MILRLLNLEEHVVMIIKTSIILALFVLYSHNLLVLCYLGHRLFASIVPSKRLSEDIALSDNVTHYIFRLTVFVGLYNVLHSNEYFIFIYIKGNNF